MIDIKRKTTIGAILSATLLGVLIFPSLDSCSAKGTHEEVARSSDDLSYGSEATEVDRPYFDPINRKADENFVAYADGEYDRALWWPDSLVSFTPPAKGEPNIRTTRLWSDTTFYAVAENDLRAFVDETIIVSRWNARIQRWDNIDYQRWRFHVCLNAKLKFAPEHEPYDIDPEAESIIPYCISNDSVGRATFQSIGQLHLQEGKTVKGNRYAYTSRRYPMDVVRDDSLNTFFLRGKAQYGNYGGLDYEFLFNMQLDKFHEVVYGLADDIYDRSHDIYDTKAHKYVSTEDNEYVYVSSRLADKLDVDSVLETFESECYNVPYPYPRDSEWDSITNNYRIPWIEYGFDPYERLDSVHYYVNSRGYKYIYFGGQISLVVDNKGVLRNIDTPISSYIFDELGRVIYQFSYDPYSGMLRALPTMYIFYTKEGMPIHVNNYGEDCLCPEKNLIGFSYEKGGYVYYGGVASYCDADPWVRYISKRNKKNERDSYQDISVCGFSVRRNGVPIGVDGCPLNWNRIK